jgi:hypothetical protein
MRRIEKLLLVNIVGVLSSVLTLASMYFAFGYNDNKVEMPYIGQNATIILKSYDSKSLLSLVEIGSAKAISSRTGVLLGYPLQEMCSKAPAAMALKGTGWISVSAKDQNNFVVAKYLDGTNNSPPCELGSGLPSGQAVYWSTSDGLRKALAEAGINYDRIAVATSGNLR